MLSAYDWSTAAINAFARFGLAFEGLDLIQGWADDHGDDWFGDLN